MSSTTFVYILLLVALTSAWPLSASQSCTFDVRRDGVAKEIKTISSHSAVDAAAIPLAPLASRTFYITPSDLPVNVTLPPANVGVTADTVRTDLVVLATLLNAAVPPDSVKYTNNANGSVTVDFIQTDRIVLPRSNVREIHEFDQTSCLIKKITGYVHGPLVCAGTTGNSVIDQLCAAAGKTS